MDKVLAIQIGALVAPIVTGILVWSLKRNIQQLDKDIGEIKDDVRTLASQTTAHGAALAGGVAKFASIEKRIDKLEEFKDQTLARLGRE
jgi:hypothetical protein